MAKTVRRITTAKRESINRLAEIIYNFLPLSARSKQAVTFQSIFAESSISHYLQGPENKKQALQRGFEKLYRYHTRLPRSIIRKLVPAAIEYRKYRRMPLKQVELNNLVKCLLELGIDMRDEFSKLVIDETLPRITVPPEKLIEQLCSHDLDPVISSEPLQLFQDGHFNEAVRKACEKFEAKVQKLSSLDKIGRDLMAKAFAASSYLDLHNVEDGNKHSFTEGFQLLSMGSMAAIRNIFSHRDEERRSPEECYEMLLFLNWMLRFVKNS